MPRARMNRIICHWTGGGYTPQPVDVRAYHYLFDGKGRVVKGKWPISANVPPLRRSRYAIHTRGWHERSIGLSVACMAGAHAPNRKRGIIWGSAPMKEVQFEAMCEKAAELSKLYRIEVTDKTILTHAEVEVNLGYPSSTKWDITHLHFKQEIEGVGEVGAYLRERIKHYLAVESDTASSASGR